MKKKDDAAKDELSKVRAELAESKSAAEAELDRVLTKMAEFQTERDLSRAQLLEERNANLESATQI